jgi:asparagine synthase (glutamine-hydrolysing)
MDMEAARQMTAARCTALLDRETAPWGVLEADSLRVRWFGRQATARHLAGLLPRQGVPDLAALRPVLAGLKGHYALVAEGQGWVLAVVDKVRSCPLFYLLRQDELLLSNWSETLEQAAGPLEQDPAAELEFRMAGYVTGRRTMRRGMRQLQAGEALLFTAEQGGAVLDRYYLFDAAPLDLDDAGFVQALAEATDAIFRRTAEDLAGRRVLIPLSAGLDSRLVLAKLLEHGHDRIQCFSYGPAGNADAKGAKVLAERMGAPWRFVPYTRRGVREYFWSGDRSRYWRFASNRASLPFMVDECALAALRQEGFLRPDDVMVNGQSGDFISGGHIRGYHFPALEAGRAYGRETALDAIRRKHFALHADLYADRLSEVEPGLEELVGLAPGAYDREALMRAYERWEWQERQSKYVINGQRSYDFAGLEWRLPLWDDEYMHFWPRVPYRLKVGQELYKRWLGAENPGGLFRDFDPPMWNWQGASMLVIPVAKAAGLVLGKAAQKKVYRAFAPFGRYSNYFAPWGWLSHLRTLAVYNKPMARYAEQWLAENP